jgi:FkbM family methyltransferase
MFAALRKYRKENRMKRFYAKLVPAHGFCFDIGANHGKYTALFLKCHAKVLAVEPQQNCYEDLKKQFGANDRVTLLQAAVGSETAKGTLHIGSNDEVSTLSVDFISAYSVYAYNSWEQQEETSVVKLDDLISRYGMPDFCKLDIEGWETEALKGLSQPVALISLEYNFLLRSKAIECIALLAEKGNYSFNFSPYETCEFSSNEWLDKNSFTAFIHALPATILHGDIFARLKK